MTNPADGTRQPDQAPVRRRPPRVPGSIPLGRWHEVEVDAHWSVLVTLGLFASILALQTLPAAHAGSTTTAYWLAAVGTSGVLLLSLVAHELAHALVARACGMQVERITLWLLGGVTELGGPSPTARVDAWVAAAGPLTSLGIGVLAALAAVTVGGGLVGTALMWLASISVLLALFNLLPGAPLDGGRLLRALLWWRSGDRERAAELSARTGRGLGYLLVGIGLLNVLAGLAGGLWLALVGWFILSGATAERAAAGDQHLAGLTAADVMTPLSVVAPSWWTVEQLVAHLSPRGLAVGAFPVVDVAGHTVGLCTLADLERVPPRHRADTQVGALAGRHGRPLVVTPDTDAVSLAGQVRLNRPVAVVQEDGHPVGLVTARELTRATHLSLLGWRDASRSG